MDPTDRQDGSDLSSPEPTGAHRPQTEAQARLDRRADALRANLRRRKAQSRSRAEVERSGPAD